MHRFRKPEEELGRLGQARNLEAHLFKCAEDLHAHPLAADLHLEFAGKDDEHLVVRFTLADEDLSGGKGLAGGFAFEDGGKVHARWWPEDERDTLDTGGRYSSLTTGRAF